MSSRFRSLASWIAIIHLAFCSLLPTEVLATPHSESAGVDHDYLLGNLQISHPWTRATVPGQSSGGVYLRIENKGPTSDRLVSASSPIAQITEIHTMSMEDNVMKMREIGSIEIKPAEEIFMQPGKGYHIMLIGLNQSLKAGDRILLTLTFEKAGKLDVMAYVKGKSVDKDSMEHMRQ
ncbi:MAG TPA: copper chaperone PCu(A)C [Herbaspirillum sp.]|nr:copper chaperone PCu(A)C [Herbaspirillum sp.]